MKVWEHKLKSHVIQAFPKIRSTKRKFSDTETGKLLEERKRIKLEIKAHPSEESEGILSEIEHKVAVQISDNYRQEINKTMGHLTAEDGAVSHQGIWKVKSVNVSKEKNDVPIALKTKKNFKTEKVIKIAKTQKRLEIFQN